MASSKTPQGDVMFDSKTKTLTIKHTGKISTKDHLEQSLLAAASFAVKNKVKNVMIDNASLKMPVDKDFQTWAHLNVELPMLTYGVDKIAILDATDERTFALIHRNDTVRKKYFNSAKDAILWLSKKS